MKLQNLIYVIMLVWSASSASAGQTYYVSADGNDAANGTSKKTPWRTLDRVAMQTFARNDRLLLAGGEVHHGSIQLGPDRSAGNFEIGSYRNRPAPLAAPPRPRTHAAHPSPLKNPHPH